MSIDADTTSTNLIAIIDMATDSGYHFFLYEFPSEWVHAISSWGRQLVINRINAVSALHSNTNEYHAYIDDVDNGSYTAGQVDSVRNLLPSGQLLYVSASTNNSIVSYADVIICDKYTGTLSEKRTLYSQLEAHGKPFQVWASIEPTYATDYEVVADHLALAYEFTDFIWIFADLAGEVDLINNGQFEIFLEAKAITF